MKAVLFDLDGTLIDSIIDIADALDTVLAERALPTVGVTRARQYIGDGARQLVARALGPARAALIDEVHAEFRAVYAANVVVKTVAYPGIDELLAALLARGHRLGVLSNKPHELTEVIVATLFGKVPFAAVHGAREGLPLKPDPAMVTTALGELGAKPSEAVMVGDGLPDMLAAQAAGVVPIAVDWGYRAASELRAAGAQAILSKPSDLLAFLDHSRREAATAT